MKKMQKYRVECNFGNKYFSNMYKAYGYFFECIDKDLPVMLWRTAYKFCPKLNRYIAKQELIEYYKFPA